MADSPVADMADHAGDPLERWLATDTGPDRLAVPRPVWHRLMGWARATEREVSGLGLLEVDAHGGDVRLVEAFLLPQRGNPVETELEPAGVAALVQELLDRDVDPAALRVWWHSHARETPFWSGLDERTIDSFAPAAMVSLVVDHRGRRLARLDGFAPRRTRLLEVVEDAGDAGDAGSPEAAVSADARLEVERAVASLPGRAELRIGGGR